MQRYIVQRLFTGIVLLVMVAAIVFFLGRLTGNPADLMLPEDATAADREALIKTLGLDRPCHEQFVIFFANALRGDLRRLSATVNRRRRSFQSPAEYPHAAPHPGPGPGPGHSAGDPGVYTVAQ